MVHRSMSCPDLLSLRLETERLLLVPISLVYREEVFKEFTPEITTYMFPKSADTIAETDAFITRSISNMEQGKELVCAILLKTTHEFVGCAGLHRIGDSTPELGVWTKASLHGHKYGREAVTRLKEFADEYFMYEYLNYPVAKENTASRKIAESLGGVIRKEYLKMNMSNRELDMVEYHIPRA